MTITYFCDICDQEFTDKVEIIKHIIDNNNVKAKRHRKCNQYQCKHCGRRFSTETNLKTHVRCHHQFVSTVDKSETGNIEKNAIDLIQDDSQDTCDNNTTVSQYDFLCEVIITESADKTYDCDTCGKQFTHSSTLRAHSRLHTGERPFKCDICDKTFRESGKLTKHKRVHTGEKPYSCHICHKKFAQSGNVITHMGTHTEIRPFSCEICEKKFKRADHLSNHIKIHTGEKPYSCDICGHKMKRPGDIKSHLKTHTDEKPFSCDICGVRMKRISDIKTHVKIHKKGKRSS